MEQIGNATGNRQRISPATVKMITMVVLILVLMIPTAMISGLIDERSCRRMEAVDEISSKWGGQQTVCGPFLSIPYVWMKDGKTKHISRAHFLPGELEIIGEAKSKKLQRNIYEAVVFNSNLEIKGFFDKVDFAGLCLSPEDVLWSQATLNLGISDLRGITQRVTGKFNGADLELGPGLDSRNVAKFGLSSRVTVVKEGERYAFSIRLNCNGSHTLCFIPMGKTTLVKLKSDWSSPSFFGAYLPGQRTVDPGFNASWNILDLNRDYPQAWSGSAFSVDNSAFGVKFLNTADTYQQSERALKYALLFILVTFVGFFLVEVITRVKIHPIQYTLVGMAIVIFYLLLISVSEHIVFGWAYLVSCIVVLALVTGYSSNVLKSRKFALIVAGVYATLYGYLFILLQLEDYSLVSGVAGLAVILGLIMYLTRNIDWYVVEL